MHFDAIKSGILGHLRGPFIISTQPWNVVLGIQWTRDGMRLYPLVRYCLSRFPLKIYDAHCASRHAGVNCVVVAWMTGKIGMCHPSRVPQLTHYESFLFVHRRCHLFPPLYLFDRPDSGCGSIPQRFGADVSGFGDQKPTPTSPLAVILDCQWRRHQVWF